MADLHLVQGEIPDREIAWMAQLYEACFAEKPPAEFAERVRQKPGKMALIAKVWMRKALAHG